jgi:2,4-dienoyl-CoA reductase-like NADH-dependent reductase (Old Yellow Enzyme family)
MSGSAAAGVPFQHLLSPIRIGGHELSTRAAMTGLALNYSADRMLGEDHAAFYAARARGGVGLIISGAHVVELPTNDVLLRADTPAVIPHFRLIAEALRPYATPFLVQLALAGVHGVSALDRPDWMPLRGVSDVQSIARREAPVPYDVADYARLINRFADAACWAAEAGLHGVELQAGHSYFLGQLLSPTYNRGPGPYAGDIIDRSRLIVEIASEIRRRVGMPFIIGIRLSYDEYLGTFGISADDSDRLVDHLANANLFDLFDISCSSYHTPATGVNSMVEPQGYLVPLAKRAKAVIGNRAAVLAIGRITTPTLANAVIADGHADLAAMTRAFIADPEIIEKARRNNAAPIVHCIGDNFCVGQVLKGKALTCLLNPVVGRERMGLPSAEPIQSRQCILVAGAGLTGLRYAAEAAERGHDVQLWEASSKVGGSARVRALLPTRSEWQVAVDDLVARCDHAGVQVRTNQPASVATVLAAEVENVVVATGARWDPSGASPIRLETLALPGADLPLVAPLDKAIERALNGDVLTGSVLIYDEGGHYDALALAELLAARDSVASVTFVSPANFIGEASIGTMDFFYIVPRLHQLNVELIPQTTMDAVTGNGQVWLRHLFSGLKTERVADTVVLATQRLPNDELYHQLCEVHTSVVRIGGCLSPRDAAQHAHDAAKLGRH